jgi:hypothetical protein
MVDLQNKWIELDHILENIKGKNTEMKEKQEVSNFLKSLGMKRVLPSVVQTRLSDRRVARIYVWKNSPIGNVGLLTGRSIDPSLHFLILETDNVNNEETDLDVVVSGKNYVSVPIPHSLKRRNTRSNQSVHSYWWNDDMKKSDFIRYMKRNFSYGVLKDEYINQVKNGVWSAMDDDDRGMPDYFVDFKTGDIQIRTPYINYRGAFSPSNQADINVAFEEDKLKVLETIDEIIEENQIPTRSRYNPKPQKRVKRVSVPKRKKRTNPDPILYDGSIPSPYETTAFDQFFPDTAVTKGGKLGTLASAVLFESPYLTKKGYNLAILYDLSDDGKVFDITIQLRDIKNQNVLVSLPFTMDGQDTENWNTTWIALSGDLIPFASAEFEKYMAKPQSYKLPTSKVVSGKVAPIVKYIHKRTGDIETDVPLDKMYEYSIWDGSTSIKEITTEPSAIPIEKEDEVDLATVIAEEHVINDVNEAVEREVANGLITEEEAQKEVEQVREQFSESLPPQDEADKALVKYEFEGIQEEPIIPITDDLLFTLQDFEDVKYDTKINYQNLWWIFAENIKLKPICDRLSKLFIPKNISASFAYYEWCAYDSIDFILSAGKHEKKEIVFGLNFVYKANPNSSMPIAFGITSQSNGLRLRVGSLSKSGKSYATFTPQKAYRLTMPYKQFKGMPLKDVMVAFFNMVLIHILSNPNILAKIGEYCKLPTRDTFTGVTKTVIEPVVEPRPVPTYMEVLKNSDVVAKLMNAGYVINSVFPPIDDTATIDKPLIHKQFSIQLNLPQPNTLVAKNIIHIIFRKKPRAHQYMQAVLRNKNPKFKEEIVASGKSFDLLEFTNTLMLFEDALEEVGILSTAQGESILPPDDDLVIFHLNQYVPEAEKDKALNILNNDFQKYGTVKMGSSSITLKDMPLYPDIKIFVNYSTYYQAFEVIIYDVNADEFLFEKQFKELFEKKIAIGKGDMIPFTVRDARYLLKYGLNELEQLLPPQSVRDTLSSVSSQIEFIESNDGYYQLDIQPSLTKWYSVSLLKNTEWDKKGLFIIAYQPHQGFVEFKLTFQNIEGWMDLYVKPTYVACLSKDSGKYQKGIQFISNLLDQTSFDWSGGEENGAFEIKPKLEPLKAEESIYNVPKPQLKSFIDNLIKPLFEKAGISNFKMTEQNILASSPTNPLKLVFENSFGEMLIIEDDGYGSVNAHLYAPPYDEAWNSLDEFNPNEITLTVLERAIEMAILLRDTYVEEMESEDEPTPVVAPMPFDQQKLKGKKLSSQMMNENYCPYLKQALSALLPYKFNVKKLGGVYKGNFCNVSAYIANHSDINKVIQAIRTLGFQTKNVPLEKDWISNENKPQQWKDMPLDNVQFVVFPAEYNGQPITVNFSQSIENWKSTSELEKLTFEEAEAQIKQLAKEKYQALGMVSAPASNKKAMDIFYQINEDYGSASAQTLLELYNQTMYKLSSADAFKAMEEIESEDEPTPQKRIPVVAPTKFYSHSMMNTKDDGTIFLVANANNPYDAYLVSKVDDELYIFDKDGTVLLEDFNDVAFKDIGGAVIPTELAYDPIRIEEAYLNDELASQIMNDVKGLSL